MVATCNAGQRGVTATDTTKSGFCFPRGFGTRAGACKKKKYKKASMPIVCHLNQRGRYECNVLTTGGRDDRDHVDRTKADSTVLPWLGIMTRFIPNVEYGAFDALLHIPPHDSPKGVDIIDAVLIGDFVLTVHTSNVDHMTRMLVVYSSETATVDDFGYNDQGTYLSRPDTLITQTSSQYRLHAPLHLTGDYPEWVRIERRRAHLVAHTSHSHFGHWSEQYAWEVPSNERVVLGMGFIRTLPSERASVWKCTRGRSD